MTNQHKLSDSIMTKYQLQRYHPAFWAYLRSWQIKKGKGRIWKKVIVLNTFLIRQVFVIFGNNKTFLREQFTELIVPWGNIGWVGGFLGMRE